jgi:hypothetical protein
MLASPRCGAKTRRGAPCRSPAVRGKGRCRMHGGATGSGAPKGNRNALKHGLRTAEAVARRRRVNNILRDGARLLAEFEKRTARVTSRQRRRPAWGPGSLHSGDCHTGAAHRRPRDGPAGGPSGS